ncbi:Mitochondrial-processing peptidase subunit alpha [Ascosphaera pollenicola]|nr:Mitochondrial-processing peptidase subunit alpha [Ascosphaera pollenicola]
MAGPVLPFKQPTRKVAWLRRDVLLFAASIGVEAKNGLHFLYEHHPRFQAFPTYPIVLTFKQADKDTVDFLARNAETPLPPNSPPLNWGAAVDAKRRLVFYKHIPPTSEPHDFEMRTRVLGVWDKRKASMMDLEHTLLKVENGKETVYTKSFETAFFVGAGGWGGPRGPKIARYLPPKTKADVETSLQTTLESAHLYRLNGDYNPLHADPPAGQALGYPGIIMHGLFSWNVAAAKVLQHFAENNEGTALRDFQARFTAPVKPGDKLDTLMWDVGTVDGVECDEVFRGETLREIRFLVKVGERTVLEDGRALLTKNKTGAKL